MLSGGETGVIAEGETSDDTGTLELLGEPEPTANATTAQPDDGTFELPPSAEAANKLIGRYVSIREERAASACPALPSQVPKQPPPFAIVWPPTALA